MDVRTDIVELRAGCAVLGVAPGIGGSLAWYRWILGGATFDWLRPATAADLATGLAERLACFPLVPFSNRIRDGCFAFGARVVRLPSNRPPASHAVHGDGWQAAWRVVARDGDRVALEYEHPAGAWPYPYRARQDIVLSEHALRLTLSVENRGREAMPVGLGLHPYLPRTPGARLFARVTSMWATDHEVMPTTLVAPDARLAGREGLPVATTALDNVFAGWQREATVLWPEHGARLAIAADAPLDFLVVYSPPRHAYFCVEPVSHCTDAFNLAAQGRSDTGMRVLEPGAQVRTSVWLRPSVAQRRGKA